VVAGGPTATGAKQFGGTLIFTHISGGLQGNAGGVSAAGIQPGGASSVNGAGIVGIGATKIGASGAGPLSMGGIASVADQYNGTNKPGFNFNVQGMTGKAVINKLLAATAQKGSSGRAGAT